MGAEVAFTKSDDVEISGVVSIEYSRVSFATLGTLRNRVVLSYGHCLGSTRCEVEEPWEL